MPLSVFDGGVSKLGEAKEGGTSDFVSISDPKNKDSWNLNRGIYC